MKLPKRPEAHVIETESCRLLQHLAPREWIIRELTERDYGIDVYIELVSNDGKITGDLMSVQLKANQGMEWKSTDGNDRFARSPSVKTTTAAYWHCLPVPVFLFVADLSVENIFFVPVQEHIRRQFDNLENQQTITFPLWEQLNLRSNWGLELLYWYYSRERMYDHFVFHITNLINQVEMFDDFIRANQDRDSFLEVDAGRHLQFRVLHEACRMASIYLHGEWTEKSLDELYREDREKWKDDFTYLHEETLDIALQAIEKVFPTLVRKAIELVTVSQASYWQQTDPVFFKLCIRGDLDWILKQ